MIAIVHGKGYISVSFNQQERFVMIFTQRQLHKQVFVGVVLFRMKQPMLSRSTGLTARAVQCQQEPSASVAPAAHCRRW